MTPDNTATLSNFFNTVLLPILKRLKVQGRMADAWGISIFVSGAMIFVGGYFTDSGKVALFFLVFMFVSIYLYTRYNDRFENDFKNRFVRTIIDHLQPGISYQPDESLTPSEYVSSSLLRYRYDYFEGSDLMEGVYHNVSFRCSQILTEADVRKGRQSRKTVFQGVLFNGQISSDYAGGTYFWIHGSEQLAGSIMDDAYRLFPMPYVEDVPVHDETFRKKFRVCSTDINEATFILDKLPMTKILALIRQLNTPVSISFVVGRCYVAIPFDNDVFGASSNVPVTLIAAKDYFDAAVLIPQIIDAIELERFQ